MATNPIASLVRPRTAGTHSPDAVRPAAAADLVKLARPKQWTKNVLVFAAPAAGGALFHLHTLLTCVLTFVAFALVSSAVYCVNDTVDAAADRLHPRKRLRPVASGVVPKSLAISLAAMLAFGGLALGMAVAPGLGGVLAIYLVMQGAYIFALKHEPVVELMLVASGFVLRTLAGGVATGITLSTWFVACAGGAALLIVAAKRLAEIERLGSAAGAHRKVLAEYTPAFLRLVVGICGTLVTLVYCLWAFGESSTAHQASPILLQVSAVPFLAMVLRYVLLAEQGGGGEPEEVVLSHRALQLMGLTWAVLFLLGVAGA